MRLIDADELNERFESSCTTECACCPYSDDNCGLVHEADTVNAIPIPENATNGEILRIIFPNMHYTLSSENKQRVVTTIGIISSFDLEWWIAPYKTESEVKEVYDKI